MKPYKIKYLIAGAKVKPEFKGKFLVCCKSDKGYTHITHESKAMRIEGVEPLAKIQFPDNYGRGSYFLDYYEWKPVQLEIGKE